MRGGFTRQQGRLQTIELAQYMHHAFAVLQRGQKGLAQQGFVGRIHFQTRHRQFNRVFFETVQAWKAQGGQELTIDTQMREAAWTRPIGQLGVNAFAVHHQRTEQANVLAAVLAQQQGRQAFWRLGLDSSAIFGAMLCAQLHIQQAQKMPDLGGGAHRGFATTTAESLFDGDGGRNAIHRIHLGPPGRLHDAAGIGIEAFQITPLALIEQNIKSQGRFTRAADTRHHIELATRNVHAQAFQVVFFGIDDADVVVEHRTQVLGVGLGSRERFRWRTCNGISIDNALSQRSHRLHIVPQGQASV